MRRLPAHAVSLLILAGCLGTGAAVAGSPRGTFANATDAVDITTDGDDGDASPPGAAPRRPRAEPLPGPAEHPRRDRRRPAPPRDDDDEGPIGCPDRRQKLELIV